MKKIFTFVLSAALLTSVALAQTPAQSGDGAAPNTVIRLAPGTIIRVELIKSVDAKKTKAGDELTAKTLDDFLGDKNDVLAPRGSKVVAHVAEVSPRQGDSASTLGIAFDKIVLKSGTEVPLKASIQAIGRPEPNLAAATAPMSDSGPGAASHMPSTGRSGSSTPTTIPGNTTPGTSSTGTAQDADSAAAINGQLTPKAQGVVGMSGVSLTTGATQDSLLTSEKHNVKLDSGTQMILRVTE
jgi:hypothetical protein